MAHIVLITNGMSSMLHSNLEMSRRLRDEGHRVTYLAPAALEPRLLAQGEACVGLEHDREMARRLADDPRPPLARPLDVVRWLARRRRLRRTTLTSDEVTERVRELDPDLLLIDVEMHAAIMATAKLGVPTVLGMHFFTVFRRPGLPPLHFTMMPGESAGARLRIAVAWGWVRADAFVKRVRQRFSRTGLRDLFRPPLIDTVKLTDLRPIARHHGYDLRAETDRSQWLRPHVYRHLPVLCYNVVEMELPHEPPAVMHYVGPMVKTNRTEPPLDGEDRRRWDAIVNAREANASPRPLVYCSLGTVWAADTSFLRRVLDVFAQRPDWDLVLGLGGVLSRTALDPIPENALVLDWAPQLEILAHADAAISHGGVNSLCECVWFGVPLVTCSTKHVDQNGNAARIAYHRLGVRADKDTADSAELERLVERVLTDEGIRGKVEAMQARMHRSRDEGEAIRVVEAHVARRADA